MRDGVASETARHVVAHRLRCPRLSTAYGRPEDDEALSVEVAGDVEVGEGRMHAYLCRRTWFFDRVVVDALDGGFRQVVLVGAGYDGRAMRYKHEHARFYEVDHPSTQSDKLERLHRLGLSTGGIAFVGVDLATDDLDAALHRAGLLDDEPSLFVIEGVAAYLGTDVLAAVLGTLRALAAPASRLAISVGFSQLRSEPEAAARAQAFREAVAAMGEPIRNDLGVEGLAALLEASGWAVRHPGDALAPDAARFGLVLATTVAD